MCQRLIPTGEQFGLLTHTAAMASGSLCVRMNCRLRFWNSNQRSALAASVLDDFRHTSETKD